MQIFWGKVRQGDKRGRELGYPTANMALHKNLGEGVFVSEVKVDGDWYPALTFLGKAETFGKTDYKAESWLLDFDDNLYGKLITVRLLKKLRGNKKFESAESLIVQMKQDEKDARGYFRNF